MTPDAAHRYARQIALAEIGPEGQARICGARVVVVGSGVASEVAALYLDAAGVGTVQRIADLPTDGPGWLAALAGADVVVRSGFDDDAMAGAAARLGVGAVVVRGAREAVDVVAFPRRPPAPEAALDVPRRLASATAGDPGAVAVLAGALAAAEALQMLAPDSSAARPGGIRHLRVPFDGSEPLAQEIGAR